MFDLRCKGKSGYLLQKIDLNKLKSTFCNKSRLLDNLYSITDLLLSFLQQNIRRSLITMNYLIPKLKNLLIYTKLNMSSQPLFCNASSCFYFNLIMEMCCIFPQDFVPLITFKSRINYMPGDYNFTIMFPGFPPVIFNLCQY